MSAQWYPIEVTTREDGAVELSQETDGDLAELVIVQDVEVARTIVQALHEAFGVVPT